MDCVEVCPVDASTRAREHASSFIRTNAIDCGVCRTECPRRRDQARDTVPGLEKWLALNAEYVKIWAQYHR